MKPFQNPSVYLIFPVLILLMACQSPGPAGDKDREVSGRNDTSGIIPAMIALLDYGDRGLETRHKLDSLLMVSRKTNYISGIAKGIMLTGALQWDNPDSAIFYLRMAREFSRQHHDDQNYFLALQNMGSLYLNYGIKDSAIYYLVKALAAWKPSTGMARHARLQLDFGSWYSARDNYRQSLNFLIPAMITMKKLGDTTRLRSVYLNLGLVYVNLLNFEKAKYYFGQVFSVTPETFMNGRFWANNYNNLGKAWLDVAENYDSAQVTFRKSIDICKKYAIQERVSIIYLNMGITFFELHQVDSARFYLDAALKNIDKFTPGTVIAGIYINNGVVMMAAGKNDSARYFADKGMKLLSEEGAGNLKISGEKLLFHLDSARGQYLPAIGHLEKSMATRDALHNREILMKVAEKEFAYDLEMKNSENKYLKEENSLKSGIISNQRIILAFAILVILMIAGILVFLAYNRRKLERLNQTKDKFMSIISHDLRSPFNSLLGLLNELHSGYKDFSDEERLNILTMLNVSSQNTYHLLENLLEWSRSQQGKITSNPELIEVKPHIEFTLNLLQPRADKKGITLTHTVTPETRLFADPVLFDNCILNITNNAIKFTPAGGSIAISCIPNEKSVVVCCSDTGIGIPAASLDQLFRLDGNVKRPGTEKEPGTGLGLILCKEFVDLMKGTITVESAENRGTTVCIELPAKG